jgi:hypothetical protein
MSFFLDDFNVLIELKHPLIPLIYSISRYVVHLVVLLQI